MPSPSPFRSHELVPNLDFAALRYELKPVRDASGREVEGLYAAWIVLDNEAQLNSYTTAMIGEVILAFRRASEARDVVAVVLTGRGTRAFCTGGNTKEYGEYYAGRPEEYRRYMRLFNDMVSAVLHCDKPVICRVNGMRVGGGQEVGMACDYSIASDLAVFGQAGPKHGSAPDGGATDFLPLFVGIEQAIRSCTLCEPWSAYEALRLGLISEAVPVLRVGAQFIPNPLVVTDRYIDQGQVIFGTKKQGTAYEDGKRLLAEGEVDLTRLDAAVNRLVTQLALTMPGCLTRTLESLRRHKLAHWDNNREQSRAWLSLNMMTEGRLGFRAFNEGPKGKREVDFLALRRALAQGEVWSESLIESLIPKASR